MSQKHYPARRGDAANRAYQNQQSHYTVPPDADNLLSRLEGVRRTGADKWLACCPAHEDRSPSLSIKTVDDRVLVHCFGGCGIDDVLAALGLTISDLFPKQHGPDFDASAPQKSAPRFRASELLDLAAFEARIVALAALDIARGLCLSGDDVARVALAANTLEALVREVTR